MKHHYIFYTEQGVTLAPDGATVENLQILGLQSGRNDQQAMEQLLMDNPWIKETGYDAGQIIHREIFSQT